MSMKKKDTSINMELNSSSSPSSPQPKRKVVKKRIVKKRVKKSVEKDTETPKKKSTKKAKTTTKPKTKPRKVRRVRKVKLKKMTECSAETIKHFEALKPKKTTDDIHEEKAEDSNLSKTTPDHFLHAPIHDIYEIRNDDEKAYVDALDEKEELALRIAIDHLESSFSLSRSIGFKKRTV